MEAPVKINRVIDNSRIIQKLVKTVQTSNNFSATDMKDPKVKQFVAEEVCKIIGGTNENN